MSETRLPENSGSDGVRSAPEAPAPVPSGKTGIDGAFLLLGILTPGAIFGLTSLAELLGFYSDLTMAAYPLHLVVSIFMFLGGLQSGNARLRSYGVGGLAAYGVLALFVLLLFGTCMIGI